MNKWIKKWLTVYLKSYINLILYHRNVYPSSTFDLTTFQGFNLPQFLPINRNETLQNYIEELISDLLVKITHIYRVSICIIDIQNELCIEKYVLDFGEFKHFTNKDEEEKQSSVLLETDIFDEFRSSLNSLIVKLEKLERIKDATVSFEVAINTLEMNLGHGVVDTIGDKDNDQVSQFERDTNWTKMKEDEKLPDTEEKSHQFDDGIIITQPTQSQFYKPKLKMIPLVGCDMGPFIIHNYIEQLLMADNSLGNVYINPTKLSSL